MARLTPEEREQIARMGLTEGHIAFKSPSFRKHLWAIENRIADANGQENFQEAIRHVLQSLSLQECHVVALSISYATLMSEILLEEP